MGFDFGANWAAFSARRVDPGRLGAAVESLKALLQRETLRGQSFLDVGCGSGLFAVAAHALGAARIVGIDIDPRCIAVSEDNRARLAPAAPIAFRRLSALDTEGVRALGVFDVVYAWGSLHHTGAMWEALRIVSERVAPAGVLVLALYNRHATSPAWLMIKRAYNRLPAAGRRITAIAFAGIIYVAKLVVTRRNPLRKQRGMDFWHDVVDWIGGYPYEYATVTEVDARVSAHGFALRRCVRAEVPTGCNEFVFERAPVGAALRGQARAEPTPER